MIGENEFISVGVPREEIEEFYLWAFGDDYYFMRLNGMDDVWNERHGDIFIVQCDDLVTEAFERIGRAYLERTKEQNNSMASHDEGN